MHDVAEHAPTRPPLLAKVPEITVLFSVIIGGFAVTMRLQLRATRYHAPTYWSAVALVAVFGTMVADVLHVATDLSYWVTSAFYAAVVAGLFTYWFRTEGTLSIMTGLTLHWNFFSSGLLFLGAIAVPLVAWRTGLNATVAFWTAYVLTRPLGASFADWVAKEHRIGAGLGVGDGPVTLVMLLAIAGLVAVVAVTRSDVQEPGTA